MVTYILKTVSFADWAMSRGIDDEALASVIREMDRGLTGNALGSSVYKMRIRLSGRGKRGGGRVLVAYRPGVTAIFLLGFGKSERANISKREIEAIRKFGKELLSYSGEERARALQRGALLEVEYRGEESENRK